MMWDVAATLDDLIHNKEWDGSFKSRLQLAFLAGLQHQLGEVNDQASRDKLVEYIKANVMSMPLHIVCDDSTNPPSMIDAHGIGMLVRQEGSSTVYRLTFKTAGGVEFESLRSS